MNRTLLILLFSTGLFLLSCQKSPDEDLRTGTVKITFKNTVKGNPLVLNTGVYSNSFGEQYNVAKFKYYISNVVMNGTQISAGSSEYYLVDEGNAASLSFSFTAKSQIYSSLSFLLGVDSARNVSGAQTGALDPLNDMFWTWNSGYIMAKLEGTSPQSTVVNNKVEYHIGGFAGTNSVLKNINLTVPSSINVPLNVDPDKTCEIFIEADLDTWWQGAYDLKIAVNPAATHPGALAKNISDNYSNMFKINDVKLY